jgi:hypothetical protein
MKNTKTTTLPPFDQRVGFTFYHVVKDQVVPRKVVKVERSLYYDYGDVLWLDDKETIAYNLYISDAYNHWYSNYFVNVKEAFEFLIKNQKSSLKSKQSTFNNLPKQISELEAKIKENEDILNTL